MSDSGSGECCNEFGGECVVSSDIGTPKLVPLGPPYPPASSGTLAPEGLELLLALIDGRYWPLQVCGDPGIGTNAAAHSCFDHTHFRYTEIDPGPFPVVPNPDGPFFPGVGITAYGCQLNCDYEITGDLGADVILGKIDGQWHILRVTGNCNNSPLTRSNNECRCCGYTTAHSIATATILKVEPSGCGGFACGDEYRLSPVSGAFCGDNPPPLDIQVHCLSTADSEFEDIDDWQAMVCGQPAEIISVQCCTSRCELICHGDDYELDCGFGSDSGSASGSGSGSAEICVTAITIQTGPLSGCGGCDLRIRVIFEAGEPCEEFEDEPIDIVTMEACGMPDLEPGDRVIMATIPGGIPGREALGGCEPVEHFMIRACSSKESCADPCDPEEPAGPPCCGKLCSEMPAALTMTIEVEDGKCACSDALTLTLTKIDRDTCDFAADTKWSLVTPIPDNTFCPGETNEPPGGPYPQWLDIEQVELMCDSGVPEERCAPDPDLEGPPMNLQISGGQDGGGFVQATQNLIVSCCDPFYLEFDITGNFCMAAGAGQPDNPVTLHITITE